MNSIVLDATAVALVYFMRSITETPTLRTTSVAEPLSKPRDLLRALEIPLCYEYLTTQERTVIFLVCYAGNGIQSIMLANQTLYQRPLPLV